VVTRRQGLQVQIPPEEIDICLLCYVFLQVEASATGRSHILASHTECECVFVCV
jgi:hypothetical protein